MDWYTDYKLVKDGDGYNIEIFLNNESTEFSTEFLSNIKENVLQLDGQIKKLLDDKFAGYKINTVKLLVGTLIVASIPFIAIAKVKAADVSPVSTQTTSQTTGISTLNTTGVVTATKLNMRTGPSTSYSIAHVLWQGNRVKVIGQTEFWYQIQLSDGRIGWVSKTYLNLDLRQQKINIVIYTAKSFIGTPYVWGGESPSEGGFDCSGFTQYIFKQAGYSLARTSTDQSKQGTPISRSTIQPGDLIFYSFNRDGNISHVGLYLGGGKMIHSPKTSDTVKITDITTAYWQDSYVTARRIIA